ncbi:ultra-long-chain fatty acid omega-hydroxylase-like [Haliotis cracherodii]|uniref:ultra-long-chain fatty acid omega-hydroxylase-like n=1 Tax=Haliotis cracherodii TaxID=6455 RepID=UPI0039EADE77
MEGSSFNAATILNTIIIASLGYLTVKSISGILKFLKFRRIFNAIPGEQSFNPLFGTLHKFPGPNEAGIEYDFKIMQDVAPKIVRVWAGPFLPVIILHHPDTVRHLLKSSEPKPRGQYVSGPYDMGVPWLGEGLLIANGARWARSRRLLTPAFHFDILKPYISINNQSSNVLLNKITEHSKTGKTFEVFNVISLCALDIILRCAFSYTSDCQTVGENHPYIQAVNNLTTLWSDRSLNPLLYTDFVYFRSPSGRKFLKACDYVHQVAEEIIESRRKVVNENGPTTQDNGKKKILDFLDILLTARDEDGNGLTSLEIRNEVDTFLFEGHDTTTSGMSWMLYHMAKHPEYQTRVQEEIDTILKGRESDNILWEDLPKLEYFSLCLKESMRNRTPVPFIERELTKDIVLDGYHVPKGTFVAVQLYNLCHNPHVWERPLDYYPERFLAEEVKAQDPFAYVPFSAGPRNCIGQNFAMHEMKVVLARILHRFTLRLDEDHVVKMKSMAVLRTETGIMMYATPRTPA